MRSISQGLKIAGSLALLCLVLLLILPDAAQYPRWPDRPARQARIVQAPPAPAAPAPAPPVTEEQVAPETPADPANIAEPGESAPVSAPASQPDAEDERIFHRAVAVTATDFEVDGLRISLGGLESLPFDETCRLGSVTAPCGAQARTALRGWLRGRSLACDIPQGETGAEVTALCTVGNEDVALWLVRQGWARPGAGSPYAREAEQARAEQRGLWRYEATPPGP